MNYSYHTPRVTTLDPGGISSGTPAMVPQYARQDHSMPFWSQDLEYVTPPNVDNNGLSQDPPQQEIPSFLLPPTLNGPCASQMAQDSMVNPPPRGLVADAVISDSHFSQPGDAPGSEVIAAAGSPRQTFCFSPDTERAIKKRSSSRHRRIENGRVRDEVEVSYSKIMRDIEQYAEHGKKIVRDGLKRDLEVVRASLSPKDKSLHRSRREAKVSRVKNGYQAGAMKGTIYYLLQEISELKSQAACCRCRKIPKHNVPPA